MLESILNPIETTLGITPSWKPIKEGNFLSPDNTQTNNGEDKAAFININNGKFITRITDRNIENLKSRVYSVNIPDKWRKEGIAAPTIQCKEIAAEQIADLYSIYNIYPERISATIEEGIFVLYKDYYSRKDLSIEIYNDLDIAVMITKGKEIIKSVDILDQSFEDLIKIFHER